MIPHKFYHNTITYPLQEVYKWEHGLRLTGTMKSGHGHLLCGISVSPTSGHFATFSRDKVENSSCL